MSTQPQLILELLQTGFSQILAATDTVTDWSFPIIYEVAVGSDPAQTAEINIGGQITQLIFGQQEQTIKGSGTSVVLTVDLGPCTAVKIGSNPFNESGCNSTYPLISIFSAGDELDVFQFACMPDSTSWNLDVTLEVSGDVEIAPPDVGLLVDGASYAQIPQGSSVYDPSGATLAFQIGNFQGIEIIKLGYTLQAS